MFKVGNIVRVKSNADISSHGRKYRGKIGKVIIVRPENNHLATAHGGGYVILDIEKLIEDTGGGIWFCEVDLISEKREIKQYGIVKFMQETT